MSLSLRAPPGPRLLSSPAIPEQHRSAPPAWRQDDKRHGQGRHTYADGESYYGGWRDDRKHGRGKFVYASGAVYEGEWAADKRHGRGKFIYADGDKFEGDFVEDQQHGEGRRAEPRTAP